MKNCRGILTVLVAVAVIGKLNAESLSWQYGKSLSVEPASSAQPSSGGNSKSLPQEMIEENTPVAEAPVTAAPPAPEESSAVSASSVQASESTLNTPSPIAKISGMDPHPTGSKLTLQISSLLDAQWGMLKSPGLDIKDAWSFLVSKKVVKATKAFDCSSSPIIVAIIDTGVDFTHQNLKNVAWTNTKELNGKKGVDDDHNGFVDDVNGWDFTTNSPIILDGHGHGTHLAGIISGKSSEPNGFKGVCPGIKIMSLRYFATDLSGLKNLENTVKAIKYAIKNGANIINYSGGGSSYASDEYMALKEATDKGILLVAAAGNERSDTAIRPYFPASYDLKNIISVAGVGTDGRLIPASNWGKTTVDVAAPGGGILSLQQNQTYGFMNGTSQATAFVSGLAGLIWSVNPKLKAADVKLIIEKSVAKSKFLKNKVETEGTVDADLAMKMVAEYKIPRSRNDFKKVNNTTRILSGLQGSKGTAVEKRE
jgi:thermitase